MHKTPILFGLLALCSFFGCVADEELDPALGVDKSEWRRHHRDGGAGDASTNGDASGTKDASVTADASHASDAGLPVDAATDDAGDPTTPPSTSSAQRLFMSDFGGTVAMATPTLSGSETNGRWPIVGGDDGYDWPILINGGGALGLQPIANSILAYNTSTHTLDSPLGSPMFGAEIVIGTRHDGSNGPMLHQAQYQDMDGVMQLPYIVNPGADVTDCYIQTWMKLDPSFVSQLEGGWSTFAEWKDSEYGGPSPNPGYRIAIYIMGDGSWDMHGDNIPQGPWFWDQTNHTTPIPLGQWFKFEWAWHRTHDSSSWVWVKINGSTIMEQHGGGTASGFYGATDSPIDRVMISQLYGSGSRSISNPFQQWTDHVEVWNGVP